MATQIQLRRDTADNWTSNNTILAIGEAGFETDTLKIKVGDGSTAWTSLSYLGGYGGIPGSPGMVFFNVNDDLGANANLTFQTSTNTLSVNGNIQITNTAVATPYNVGSITDDLTINFNNGNHQYFTFSNTVANKTITLLAPTNTKNGLIGSIRIKKDVSPANATFVFAKEWYFSGGAVPDINGSLTFEQFGYLDYYVHASGEVRASFSGPFANTTNL